MFKNKTIQFKYLSSKEFCIIQRWRRTAKQRIVYLLVLNLAAHTRHSLFGKEGPPLSIEAEALRFWTPPLFFHHLMYTAEDVQVCSAIHRQQPSHLGGHLHQQVQGQSIVHLKRSQSPSKQTVFFPTIWQKAMQQQDQHLQAEESLLPLHLLWDHQIQQVCSDLTHFTFWNRPCCYLLVAAGACCNSLIYLSLFRSVYS